MFAALTRNLVRCRLLTLASYINIGATQSHVTPCGNAATTMGHCCIPWGSFRPYRSPLVTEHLTPCLRGQPPLPAWGFLELYHLSSRLDPGMWMKARKGNRISVALQPPILSSSWPGSTLLPAPFLPSVPTYWHGGGYGQTSRACTCLPPACSGRAALNGVHKYHKGTLVRKHEGLHLPAERTLSGKCVVCLSAVCLYAMYKKALH